MEYANRLNDLWKEHLKEHKRYRSVGLFTGIGGSSLGLSAAGFQEIAAVEQNEWCCEQYDRNMMHHPINRDIRELTFRGQEVDLLQASPPCQGFSAQKKSNPEDQRNELFFEAIRVRDEVQPKVFVIENVPGILRPAYSSLLKQIEDRLSRGYRVRRLKVEMEKHGLPQARKRLLWVGVRSDVPGELAELPQTAPVSVRDAFQGLPDSEPVPSTPERLKLFWAAVQPGEWLYKGAIRLWGRKTAYNGFRLHWEQPAPTLLADSCPILLPDEPKQLSIAQSKRLMSFPDQFVLSGSYRQQRHGMGNAVPPLIYQILGEQLADMLDRT